MNDSTAGTTYPASTRPLRIWLLGSALLLLIRLVGGLVPLTDATGWLWITRIGESWVVAGILVLGVSAFPLGPIAKGVGRIRTGLLIGLVGLMFVGQYLQVDAYPFVQWGMYSTPTDPISYTEVLMMDGGIDLGHLPLVRPVSVTKAPRALVTSLEQLAEDANNGDEDAASTLSETLHALVAANGRTDVSHVEIRTCSVTDPSPAHPSTCSAMHVVQIGGGSS